MANLMINAGQEILERDNQGKVLATVSRPWYMFFQQLATLLQNLLVTVSQGGTGLGSLTAHNVLLGEGTSAVGFAAPGAAGTVLTSNGVAVDPTFQAVAGGDVVGPGSATDNALVRFDGTTGKLIQDGVITESDTGALTFPDDVRQTFNPGTNNAGINVGALAGDPASPVNGDVWYDSGANELTARINGANVSLTGGTGNVVGPGSATDGQIALFDGTTGKLIKAATGSGVVHAASGVYSTGNVDLTSEVTGDLPFASFVQATGASKLVGRGSAGGAGDFQELTLGAGMTMSGTVLNTSGSGSGTVITTRKTTQQDVTNSATLVDDSVLQFSAAASTVYWVKVLMILQSNSSAGDFQFCLDGSGGSTPSGATAWLGVVTTSSSIPGWWTAGAGSNPITLKDLGSTLQVGTAASTTIRQGLIVEGMIAMGGSAGTIALRWAQSVATPATTVSMMPNSTLFYQVVA